MAKSKWTEMWTERQARDAGISEEEIVAMMGAGARISTPAESGTEHAPMGPDDPTTPPFDVENVPVSVPGSNIPLVPSPAGGKDVLDDLVGPNATPEESAAALDAYMTAQAAPAAAAAPATASAPSLTPLEDLVTTPGLTPLRDLAAAPVAPAAAAVAEGGAVTAGTIASGVGGGMFAAGAGLAVAGEAVNVVAKAAQSPQGSFQQYQPEGSGGGGGSAGAGPASFAAVIGALNKIAGSRSRM